MLDSNAKKRLLLALIVAGSLLALGLPASVRANPASVTVYSSLANLRTDHPAPAGATATVSISAARNEAESFQLLIRGGASGNPGLSVEPGEPLSGPGGATLPASAMTIYREGYYQVTTRSDGEGEVGSWPDALIPVRDDLYGEARDAFPVNVAENSQLAVWVDVLVPVNQVPGTYTGSVVVHDVSGVVSTVPVSLTVRDFTLPSTSSLRNAYFISWGKICTAFTGSSNCSNATQAWQLETLFDEAALNNRVTIANGYAADPTSPYFSQYFVPLLQGTDSRVRLPGAKLTSVEVYGPSCGNCLEPWKAAAEKYGFAERFFLYACDEPSSSADWEQCRHNTEAAEQSWPGVRSLVTAPINQSAASYVDTFSPLVNDIDPASGSKRSSYNSFLSSAPAKELWLYTSCRSYSCDTSEGPAYDGWPGYAIDEPASQDRAMGWIAFQYDASGELYYSVDQSLSTASTNQYVSGGNGDGNLFYAGTSNGGNGSIAVGGSHPIPIETIRLKRIRDGREDYEYLHLLEQRGQAAAALNVSRRLFGSDEVAAHNTTVSTGALESARAELSAAIEGGEPPEASASPEPAPQSSSQSVQTPVEAQGPDEAVVAPSTGGSSSPVGNASSGSHQGRHSRTGLAKASRLPASYRACQRRGRKATRRRSHSRRRCRVARRTRRLRHSGARARSRA